jgi:hypothetical protein
MRTTVVTLAMTALIAVGIASTAQAQAGPGPGVSITTQVRSVTVAEGDEVPRDFIVTFEDAGNCNEGAYTVEIGWGDGTTSAGSIARSDQLDGLAGPQSCRYDVVGEHAYATAGTYPLTARVCKGADCVSGGGATATVALAELRGEAAALAGVVGTAVSGRIAEFNHRNRLAQPSQFTAVIDWGDGTTSPGVVSGQDGRFEVSGQHVYSAAGQYLVRATLLRGGVAAATSDPATAAIGAVITAASSNPLFRPLARLRTSTIRRAALRRGLPMRLTVPAAVRSLRVAVVRLSGAQVRTLGRVRVSTRGGSVVSGVRTLNARVACSKTLRARMARGRYAVRFRIGNGPLVSAGFRVR